MNDLEKKIDFEMMDQAKSFLKLFVPTTAVSLIGTGISVMVDSTFFSACFGCMSSYSGVTSGLYYLQYRYFKKEIEKYK